MVRKLKVGMVCDVITITTDKPLYEEWMQKGSTGIVKEYYPSGAVSSYIGRTDKESGCGRWTVHKSEFKVVGRLIVTKVKKI